MTVIACVALTHSGKSWDFVSDLVRNKRSPELGTAVSSYHGLLFDGRTNMTSALSGGVLDFCFSERLLLCSIPDIVFTFRQVICQVSDNWVIFQWINTAVQRVFFLKC